ncbi:MAG: hypothetical protein QXV17_04595 [Candidatus Micrarchaeaceae archaeon]
MARKQVYIVPFETVIRSPSEKTKGAAFGTTQVRRLSAHAISPRLLAYRACIAKQLRGSHPGSLAGIQQSFASVAKSCAAQARSLPTARKPRMSESAIPFFAPGARKGYSGGSAASA